MARPTRAILATAFIAIFTVPAGAAGVFWVDNRSAACSNSGAGTESEPYCTISAAAAAHNGPGTTLVVKPGVYREQITLPSSGAAGNPFVLQAQGQDVIIEGADDLGTAAQWTPHVGSTWLAAGVTWSPRQVFVDGARLTPSAGSPDSLSPNAFTWVSGEGLFVNLGTGSPGAHQTLVGRRSFGFNMFTKSWITISGFTVAHAEDRGIYLQAGCSDITIAHNAVRFANSYGIQAVNDSSLLIEDNVVSDNNNHGIGFISGTRRSTLRDNECFRNAQPTLRTANGIYLFGSPANTLDGNRLHDNQDSGIQIQSGSDDCVAFNNASWNNGDHGYDHLFATGAIHVNDVAYGNYRDGFSIEGYASGVQLHNCIAADNGLTTNRFDLWVDPNSTPGFVSDFNIFWNSTLQSPIKYVATPYSTLTDYQAASGQDGTSIQADPRFANPGSGDFHLLSGSPAIDSGNSGLPGWPTTDAEGDARLDVPSIPNTGAGPVPYADRGVIEYPLVTLDVDGPAWQPGRLRPVVSPNPWGGHGSMRFGISKAGRLKIQLFDITGRAVRTLVDEVQAPAAEYEIPLDGRANGGQRLGPGVYFYRVQAPEGTVTGRFLIVR